MGKPLNPGQPATRSGDVVPTASMSQREARRPPSDRPNAIEDPSGDQTGRRPGYLVLVSTSSRAADPSEAIVQIRVVPSYRRKKAIESPSGDHAGRETRPLASSTRSVPSGRIVTILSTPLMSTTVNAIRAPRDDALSPLGRGRV
jgi:hypothetical protein